MPRFSTGQANEPNPMNLRFSFTGKIRAADVLLRLVEVCGYEVVRRALEELKPEPPASAPKRRK